MNKTTRRVAIPTGLGCEQQLLTVERLFCNNRSINKGWTRLYNNWTLYRNKTSCAKLPSKWCQKIANPRSRYSRLRPQHERWCDDILCVAHICRAPVCNRKDQKHICRAPVCNRKDRKDKLYSVFCCKNRHSALIDRSISFLCNKTNFTNLFCHATLHVSDSSSAHHQQFIYCTLSNGISQLSSRTNGPARKLYDIYHFWVYSEWTADDGQTNCPKRVEFHAKINLWN